MTPANLRSAAATRSALCSAAALRTASAASTSSFWPITSLCTSRSPFPFTRCLPHAPRLHPPQSHHHPHMPCSIATPGSPPTSHSQPFASARSPRPMLQLAAFFTPGARRSFHIPAYSQEQSDSGPAEQDLQLQQEQQEQQEQQQELPQHSPLHYDIERFSREIYPTEEEKRSKEELIEELRAIIHSTFSELSDDLRTQVFGSYASGLCTWQSDVDLVITGLCQPNLTKGAFLGTSKNEVGSHLRKLADKLKKSRRLGLKGIEVIPKARMPIIKLSTMQQVQIDISISDASGVQASQYMLSQTIRFPQMKPLMFVLKSFLKSRGLNDVSTGGLSSYSLCNMVIAHLMDEMKHGRDTSDLGELLYSFLLRFGDEFNYEHEAVSIRNGGIVSKASLKFPYDHTKQSRRPKRLCVACPLSARDVSGGSYMIGDVQDAFDGAARMLENLARSHHHRKENVKSVNYLTALFNVPQALGRTAKSGRKAIVAVWRNKSQGKTLGEPPGPGVDVAAKQRRRQGGGGAAADSEAQAVTGSQEEREDPVDGSLPTYGDPGSDVEVKISEVDEDDEGEEGSGRGRGDRVG